LDGASFDKLRINIEAPGTIRAIKKETLRLVPIVSGLAQGKK
jgi:hypothetical protein